MAGSKRRRGKNKRKWELKIYKGVDPETGEKQYYYETFEGTECQAEKRLGEITTDMDRNEFIEPQKLTYIEFLTTVYLPAAESVMESGSFKECKAIINNHIKKDPIARAKMSDIELFHLEQFKLRKMKSSRADGKKDENGNPLLLSPKTVKNILIAVKASFVYACKLRILKYNPAQYLDFPTMTKYKATVWTAEQATKFLEAAAEDRFYFLFLLAIFYSKRKGELRGLRKQDVDLKALTASIRQSVRGSGYAAEYKNLKNKDAEQMLELEPWMVPLFEHEFSERAKEKLAFGEGYNDNSLVFASFNGNPVKERTLTEHYNKIIEKAGIPKIRFHDLRHTGITIMLKAGWSLKHAQVRAHHADIKTTGNIYAHVTPDMQRDVNRDMTKILKIK